MWGQTHGFPGVRFRQYGAAPPSDPYPRGLVGGVILTAGSEPGNTPLGNRTRAARRPATAANPPGISIGFAGSPASATQSTALALHRLSFVERRTGLNNSTACDLAPAIHGEHGTSIFAGTEEFSVPPPHACRCSMHSLDGSQARLFRPG